MSSSYVGLLQIVNQPTRLAGNILDLVITSIHAELYIVCHVAVENVGLSYHSLVTVDLNLRHPRSSTRHVTYRNIKAIDPAEFAKLICSEQICPCPPDTTHAFTDELDASVTRVLNALSPHRSRTVRTGKRSAKWLSPRAADEKHGRRRRWRRTHAESDRVEYRAFCREANREINRSRDAFFKSDLRQLAPTRKLDGAWFVNCYTRMIDERSQHRNKPGGCAGTSPAS